MIVYLSTSKNYFMISVLQSNEIYQVTNIINLLKQEKKLSKKNLWNQIVEYQIGKLKLPIFWSMFMLCILMWPISSSLKPKDASQNLHSKPWSSSFPMWIWDFCWQSSFFAKWFFLISLLSKHLGQYLHLKSFSPAIKESIIYTKILASVNDGLLIHTLFTALKGYGSTKTKTAMDRPRRHWQSMLYK